MSTIDTYDHTIARFMAGLNAQNDTYKVMLLNATAIFDRTHTTLAQVTDSGANEVYGHGWTQGGETLTEVTVMQVTGLDRNGAKFDANDVSVTLTDTLGPYAAYVVYNATDTNSPPLVFVTLTTPVTAAVNDLVGVTWSANGIFAIMGL